MNSETSYIPQSRAFHASCPLVMGTRLDLLMVGTEPGPAEALWQEALSWLGKMEKMLNRFDENGETGRINSGKTTALSGELQAVLEICAGYWLRTSGLFDVTRENFSALHWECGSIDTKGMKLDFGGIGKGLALRYLKDLLESRGVSSAYVDFGGSSILAMGRHPFGPCWKVSPVNPYTGEALPEVDLSDCSLSTSGNTPSHTGHIVSPADGKTCTSRRMVSVKCPDPLDGEVLSTALMIAREDQEPFLKGQFPLAEYTIYDNL